MTATIDKPVEAAPAGIILADARPWIEARMAALPSWAGSAIGWVGLAGYLVIPNAPDDNLAAGMILRGAVYAALLAMFASAWARRSSFARFCSRPWIWRSSSGALTTWIG